MHDYTEDVKNSPSAAILFERIAQLESKLSHLSDHHTIIEVFRRYIFGLNRHDLESLTSAFWPDAQINYGTNSSQRDEWILDWHRRYIDNSANQVHHITNQTLDIRGDVAHVESYLITFLRAKDDRSTTIIGGRYIDRVDRRDSDWRIAVREFVPHFRLEANSIFNESFTEDIWPRSSLWLGKQDKSDLSYLRPLLRRSGNK